MVEEASSFWTNIQRYEDMLVADPRSCCFAPLSELYRKLGLLDDAIFVAKKGCDLHQDYPGGFFALGAAYYAKGLSAEAREALERVIYLKPDNLQAQKLLGQLYVEAGEIDLAKKVLGLVLQQNPEDVESMLLLRSVVSTGETAQSDEESLEEEIIVDLTEVIYEPLAAETAASSEIPGVATQSGNSAGSGLPEESAAPQPWGRFEEPAAKRQARDPLTTATLAELYVTQGFIGKALSIYQELLCADPANLSYRLKCADLKQLQLEAQQVAAPGPRPEPSAPRGAVPATKSEAEAELCSWLENIRRRRDGA